MKTETCSHITENPSTEDARGWRILDFERCDHVPVPGLTTCEAHCDRAELTALARWAHATAELERLNVKALQFEVSRLRARIVAMEAESETRHNHCPGCDGDHA